MHNCTLVTPASAKVLQRVQKSHMGGCEDIDRLLHRVPLDLGGHGFEGPLFFLPLRWHSLTYGMDIGPAACRALAGIRADRVRGTSLRSF